MTTTDHDTCRALAAWLGRTPEEDRMGETAIWEPYRMEVGQRVRIRLSGECQHRSEGRYLLTGEPTGIVSVGHRKILDGLEGVILDVDHPVFSTPVDGHRYRVLLDKLLWVEGGPLRAVALSLAELIPLDDDAQQQQRRADGEEG